MASNPKKVKTNKNFHITLTKSVARACRAKGYDISNSEAARILHSAYEKFARTRISDISEKSLKPIVLKAVEQLTENFDANKQLILPDGTKVVEENKNFTVLVVEQKPSVRTISWCGKKFYLAFPYVQFIIPFRKTQRKDQMHEWTKKCEISFTNEPIRSRNDILHYTAFPNLYHLSTSCFPINVPYSKPINIQAETIIRKWWQTEFRYWQNDNLCNGMKHLQSFEKWEKQSKKNPLFVLDISWKKFGTLESVLAKYSYSSISPNDSNRVARIISNQMQTELTEVLKNS